MRKDPNARNNLAADPSHAGIIATHRGFLPKENRKPAPGSRGRILVWENGKATWQGKPIGPSDPIPGQ